MKEIELLDNHIIYQGSEVIFNFEKIKGIGFSTLKFDADYRSFSVMLALLENEDLL